MQQFLFNVSSSRGTYTCRPIPCTDYRSAYSLTRAHRAVRTVTASKLRRNVQYSLLRVSIEALKPCTHMVTRVITYGNVSGLVALHRRRKWIGEAGNTRYHRAGQTCSRNDGEKVHGKPEGINLFRGTRSFFALYFDFPFVEEGSGLSWPVCSHVLIRVPCGRESYRASASGYLFHGWE